MKNDELTKLDILGVGIDRVGFDEAIIKVNKMIEEGRGGRPQYLVKPNVEIVTYSQTDSGFKKILNSASFAPPDGVGLLIGSILLGNGLRERVGGPELMERILSLASDKGYSVYFYGAKPHVVEKLAKVVSKRFPNLQIAGYHHDYLEKDEAVEEDITKSKPDILFVALGYPKQEKWIARNLNKLKVPLSVAEGGSFDFISGEVTRAPAWMRKVGLEWLFRLICEPGRIRRQAALPRFLWLIVTKR
jgi:N-acetylglucosaminyldiphosphoundecaprenol N-acetyl-beta-D-mannosaminyltransferase